MLIPEAEVVAATNVMLGAAVLAWLFLGIIGHLIWVKRFNAVSVYARIPPLEALLMCIPAAIIGPFVFIGFSDT